MVFKTKKLFFAILVALGAFFMSASLVSNSSFSALPVEPTISSQLSLTETLTLSIKQVEEKLGKKLSQKEKIGFKIVQKKAKKAQANIGNEEGTKKQLVAFLLCFFIGFIGVHRFYMGYVGIGIAQILTLGGCGIWTLIDFIRIITLDLKNKDGSELEPW
jgi:TM2 domain